MSSTSEMQRLAPRHAEVCAKCKRRVFFKFVNSRVQAEGRFRIVYLRCPCCGAKASRLTEIIPPPD